MKALLGDDIWKRAYGDRCVDATMVCPRALATPLYLALAMASEVLKADAMEKHRKTADSLFAGLGVETTAKRRRAT